MNVNFIFGAFHNNLFVCSTTVSFSKTNLFSLNVQRKTQRPDSNFSLLTQHTPIRTAFEIEVQNRFSQLSVEDNENEPTPEEDWENLQSILIETPEKLIPKKQKVQKHLWMSDEIIKLMNVRRKHKSCNLKTYKEIDKEIRIKCKKLKRNGSTNSA